MGSSPNAADYMSRPDPTMQIMQLQQQRAIGQQQLDNQNALLGYAVNMPMETWTPDIWGQDGVAAQSAQIAAINQFKNRQLEEQTNPALAKLRRELPGKMEQELSGNSWEKQMKDWAKTTGISQYLGSGLGDSTINRSALFDAATREGAAIREAKLRNAAAYLSANPMVDAGINAGSAIGGMQTAAVQGMQQRSGFRDAMLGKTHGVAQSTSDYLNQVMASTNQAVESNDSKWDKYQNAMYKSAKDKADAKNAMIGSAISAVGTVAGAAVGGPMGAAMGSQLGKLAGGGGGGGGSDPGYQGMEDGMRVYSRPGSYRIG
jgi:hypothetical protein